MSSEHPDLPSQPSEQELLGRAAEVAGHLLAAHAGQAEWPAPDVVTRVEGLPAPAVESPKRNDPDPMRHLKEHAAELDMSGIQGARKRQLDEANATAREKRMNEIEAWSNARGKLAELKAAQHVKGMKIIQSNIDSGRYTEEQITKQVREHNVRVGKVSLVRTRQINGSSDPKYRRSDTYTVTEAGNGDMVGHFPAVNYQYNDYVRNTSEHSAIVHKNPFPELRNQMEERHKKGIRQSMGRNMGKSR